MELYRKNQEQNENTYDWMSFIHKIDFCVCSL